MQTFIMKIENSWQPIDEEESTTETIREYEFSDDIDLTCWNNATFWTYYDEESGEDGMSEGYFGFFQWLEELPENSYSLIQRMQSSS